MDQMGNERMGMNERMFRGAIRGHPFLFVLNDQALRQNKPA
jgi:hypothetical protein